ncbi:MAG: aspartate/glutamate racemase family protein, partial [Planctomycetia bacterium]|nr:aspartate/glutamate racemase family protein [Planctomycetia bacterium]
TVARMKNYTENLVYKYGFERKCNQIRAIGCEVNSLLEPTCSSNDTVEHECREAINNDDIGAIVLGCAGMANLAKDLSGKLGIPVIDGVLSGICLAEALFKCDIKTSKLRDYDYPNKKIYRGIYSHCGK